MCRGRKRVLGGGIATQRLAKLAKHVAAEASNVLMGRTFLDIDMARAADLLGMERRQAEAIRDLERGHFLGLGPAISRRPLSVRIGSTQTSTRMGTHGLMPLPEAGGEDMRSMLFTELEAPAQPRFFAPEPDPVAASEVLERIAASEGLHEDLDAPPVLDILEAVEEAEQSDAVVIAMLEEMLSAPESVFQPEAYRSEEQPS